VVDLLNKVVDPGRVHGLVVTAAHRVTETSTEAFIVRLYRAANTHGFLKATVAARAHTHTHTHETRTPSARKAVKCTHRFERTA